MSEYSRDFYRGFEHGSTSSAQRLLPPVLRLVEPRSAIDVGCGIGGWTRVMHDHGVDAIGVDGDYVDRDSLLIPPERFVARDLRSPLRLDRTFDLAISLEVAEHLPRDSADHFVAELTALAPVVLFSAAIPDQGGVTHLNEQWQSWWARLFAARGFSPFDCVRPAIWSERGIEPWYAQNAILYATPERAAALRLTAADVDRLFDVVHPGLYRRQHERPELRRLVGRIPRAVALELERTRFEPLVNRARGWRDRLRRPQRSA